MTAEQEIYIVSLKSGTWQVMVYRGLKFGERLEHQNLAILIPTYMALAAEGRANLRPGPQTLTVKA